MTKTLILALALLCALPAIASAADTVSPLDGLGLTGAESALLNQLVLRLETLLADGTLGSLKTRNATGWASAAFAAFTAGSLTERGYRVRLASGPEGPDGPHTWVVAGLLVGDRTVWIPIEPSPAFGALQRNLGRIAWESPSSRTRFDPAYTEPVALMTLPDNAPPVARLQFDEPRYEIGDVVRASASGSFDRDNGIVVYRWCLDDEPCTSSSYWKLTIKKQDAGEYVLTLTVIDAGGRSATASARFVVADPQGNEWRSAGCGCDH